NVGRPLVVQDADRRHLQLAPVGAADGGGLPPLQPDGLGGLLGRGRERFGGLVPLVGARPRQQRAGQYGDDRDHLLHEILFSGGFAAGGGRWTHRPPPPIYFFHHPAPGGDPGRGPRRPAPT